MPSLTVTSIVSGLLLTNVGAFSTQGGVQRRSPSHFDLEERSAFHIPHGASELEHMASSLMSMSPAHMKRDLANVMQEMLLEARGLDELDLEPREAKGGSGRGKGGSGRGKTRELNPDGLLGQAAVR